MAAKKPWVMGPHKVPLKPDSESDLAWKARTLANREAAKIKTEPMAKIQAKPVKARPPVKTEAKEEDDKILMLHDSEDNIEMLYDSKESVCSIMSGSMSAVVDPGATATILTTSLAEALFARGHLQGVEFSPREFGTANSSPLKTTTRATMQFEGLQSSPVFIAAPEAGLRMSLLGIPSLRNLVLVMNEHRPTLQGRPLTRAPNGHFIFQFDSEKEIFALSDSAICTNSDAMPDCLRQAAMRLGLH